MRATTAIKLSAASLVLSATGVKAADQADVDFLTALVDDYQAHKTQYIQYLATASSIPMELATIATHVLTYTDHSYTTLLDNPDLDIGIVESFASDLPWRTRLGLGAAAGGNSEETSAATTTTRTSESHETDNATSETGHQDNTTTTDTTLTRQTTTSGTRTTAQPTTVATTQRDAAGGLIAPVGAAVGAIVLAML